MASSDDLPPDQLFLKSLPLIEKIIAFASRRSRFSREDGEDFSSWVKLKLIEDDYGVLRQFKGGCSLGTYLSVVIQRLAQDYRNHLWSKWRPSAEALRLGPLAVRLEQLLVREEYSFDEACQILWVNEGIGATEAELSDLRAKLPPRTGRHVVSDEALQAEASPDPGPEQQAEDHEIATESRRILMALYRSMETLSTDDRVLVKLRTRMSVADIARARKVAQKPLYSRLKKAYKALAKALEREGVRKEDVKKILGRLQPDRFARPKKKG
ncbi:MAG: sigma-70 family RNA polymerase sigma factor [Thermoanaerobaculia bacterium]